MRNLVQYVNTFAGTKTNGETYPGATVPFGMIQWSPDTGPLRRPAGYKYYQYLNWGIKKGYMTGAAHSYYQNAGPGTFYQCCYSKNPKFREIYDKTYDFIKGTYTETNVH